MPNGATIQALPKTRQQYRLPHRFVRRFSAIHASHLPFCGDHKEHTCKCSLLRIRGVCPGGAPLLREYGITASDTAPCEQQHPIALLTSLQVYQVADSEDRFFRLKDAEPEPTHLALAQ